MKRVHMAVVGTLIMAVSCSAAATNKKHLFILSGQSNMGRFDSDLYFNPHAEAEFGADKVCVVRDAHGGKSIKEWYKDDLHYTPAGMRFLVTDLA